MDENQQEVPETISEVDYFIQVVDSTSEAIISDNSIERNKSMIRNITDGLHDRNNRQGDLPPHLAGKILDIVFSSITKYGLR